MISKEETVKLEHIVIKLKKFLVDDTDIKKFCNSSPKFREMFFEDLRKDGWHESMITLIKYIIDH